MPARLLPAAFFALSLTACIVPGTGDEDDDDGTNTSGEDGGNANGNDGGAEEYEGCEETWVNYVGEDEPVVGDEWTVWLYCDDALLTGPMIIRFDPLDFATVYDNVVTWRQTGEAMMYVQTGAERAELTVTVGE